MTMKVIIMMTNELKIKMKTGCKNHIADRYQKSEQRRYHSKISPMTEAMLQPLVSVQLPKTVQIDALHLLLLSYTAREVF